jgi:hypothetical protein
MKNKIRACSKSKAVSERIRLSICSQRKISPKTLAALGITYYRNYCMVINIFNCCLQHLVTSISQTYLLFKHTHNHTSPIIYRLNHLQRFLFEKEDYTDHLIHINRKMTLVRMTDCLGGDEYENNVRRIRSRLSRKSIRLRNEPDRNHVVRRKRSFNVCFLH